MPLPIGTKLDITHECFEDIGMYRGTTEGYEVPRGVFDLYDVEFILDTGEGLVLVQGWLVDDICAIPTH